MEPGFRMPVLLLALVMLLNACSAPPVAEEPPATVTVAPTEPAQPSATPQSAPSATTEPSVTATSAPTVTATSFPTFPPPSPTPEFPTSRLDETTFANMALLRTEGFGQALSAAVSPDNRLLAVATTAGIAWFDLTSLEHLRFDRIDGGASKLAFSPDGTLIEVGIDRPYTPARTEQRRVDSGELITVGDPPPPPIEFPRIFFSSDELLRAELNVPDSVPTPGVIVFRTSDESIVYRDDTTMNVAFSPDSRLILLVDYLGTVRIVDSADGMQRSIALPGYTATAFSPDALSLIGTGRDLRIWDVVSGELRQRPQPITFAGDPGLIGIQQHILFSADGSRLTIDGGYAVFEALLRRSETWQFGPDGLALMWRQDIGGPGIMTYETYAGAVSPSGPTTAVTTDSFTLTIGNDGEPERNLTFTEQINTLSFSPDGAILAVGEHTGGLSLLRVVDGSEIGRITFEEPIVQLVFSRDGTRLGVVLAGGDVIMQPTDFTQASLRLPSAQQPVWPRGLGVWPTRMRFSPDGSLLLAWDYTGARFYNLSDGTLLHTIEGRIDDMDIGPQRRLVTLLRDGRIELWGLPN